MNSASPIPAPYGVLSGPEICQELYKGQLVIMPPLYDESELKKANCLDVRLGHEFILMRKAELSALTFQKDLNRLLRRFYETTYVGFNDDFVLHPGDLVLGATLEYIVLPNNIMAYIIGRSSWGRLGLIIATATVIHPGYKGCPTLELVNNGNIPIHLFPGAPIPIAQLSLHWVGPGQNLYSGRYSENRWVGPTGPGYSRIHVGQLFEKWIAHRDGETL